MKERELIEKAIGWINDLTQQCERLTTANVSHQGANIRGKAKRCAEFIRKDKEQDTELLTLTASWFDGVADHTTRLTTGNVSHQGATTRCLAREAANFLRDAIKEGEQHEIL